MSPVATGRARGAQRAAHAARGGDGEGGALPGCVFLPATKDTNEQ